MLLPVLSVVLAAYAARRLSRWASGGDGWLAFWFVGLLSPVLFYGADFWEHAPALALALLAVALVLEGGGRKAVVGGLVAGLAVIMRNDLLATFAALGVAALLVPEERRRCRERWRELAAGCGALIAVVFAQRHRRARGARVGARARHVPPGAPAASGADFAGRLRDAVITSVGVLANDYWLALVIGGVIGIGILLLASSATDTSERLPIAGVVGAVVAWGGMIWRFSTFGVSTVPGFLCAAPIAALGFFGERTRREQVLFVGAAIAIPTVWMTEWVGGHTPQWGGRYLLLPTSLLVVLAASQVRRLGARPLVLALVGLSVAMSVVGVAWHIERTRAITRFAQDVMAAPADVVVIGDQPWMGSEVGTWYGDRRWLTTRADDGDPNEADPAGRRRQPWSSPGRPARPASTSSTPHDHALDRMAENPPYDGLPFRELANHEVPVDRRRDPPLRRDLTPTVHLFGIAARRYDRPDGRHARRPGRPRAQPAEHLDRAAARPLIVFTGLSGSGKSSLAFDTIYAEGQRRYVESLSSYARQFLGQMDKPDVDFIEGLSPAISIDQKSASRNPRSTVGTITEVYDYLRLLYARIGVPHCPNDGTRVTRQTPQQIVDRMLQLPDGTRFQVLAPVVRGRKGKYETLLADLATQGFVRARIDGEVHELTDMIGDTPSWRATSSTRSRSSSIGSCGATASSDGSPTRSRPRCGSPRASPRCRSCRRAADEAEAEILTFTQHLACPQCGTSFDELAPAQLLVQLAVRRVRDVRRARHDVRGRSRARRAEPRPLAERGRDRAVGERAHAVLHAA